MTRNFADSFVNPAAALQHLPCSKNTPAQTFTLSQVAPACDNHRPNNHMHHAAVIKHRII